MEPILVVCPACHKRMRLSDRANLGKMARCPQCGERFELRAEGDTPPAPPPAPNPKPSRGIPPPEPPVPSDIVSDDIQVAITPPPRFKRTPAKKRGVPALFIALSMFVSLGLIAWVLWSRPAIVLNRGNQPPPQAASTPETNPQAENDLASQPNAATPSGPIRLTSLPGGVRLMTFLRPRQLRQAGRTPHELWECSGPLGVWSAKTIQAQTFAQPEEIDELLFGWVLGPAGTVPQLVMRVRPVPSLTRDILAQRLGQSFIPGMEPVWRTSPDRAVLWTAEGEYVIVPTELAEEVPQASITPLPTDRGIEELLMQSSRTSLLTCLAIPLDLEIHREALFAPPVHSLLTWVGSFLGQQKKCEAVSVTVNWTPEESSLQLRMRSHTGVRIADFQQGVEQGSRDLASQLQGLAAGLKLPENVLPIARRFPAMVRELQQNLRMEVAGRDLSGRAVLPERAWPNLLAAGVLTFYGLASAPSPAAAAETKSNDGPPVEKTLNLSLEDRLRLRLDVDFRDVPLEDALDYIAQEIGCKLEIDGDALKNAGYTRNMPQRMRVQQKQASEVFGEILSRYTEKDAMVLAVEKPEGPIWATTRSAATAKKWKILSLEGDKPPQ
ncbi:MAG: hypothetical protein U0903_14790 [Planctomycetales bacterium]